MMENQPLISVIMPCYNMERFVSETIDSVRRQTYPNWELCVVDDASTDHTAEIVQQCCATDSRIHLFVKDMRSGIADTRNQAINMAKGHYLAFLDADDLWYPEKLETQLQFMTEHNVGFCYASYDCVDESGKPTGKTVDAAGDMNYNAYLHNTIIGCSTVMLNIDKVGKVTVPNFRTSEDTATWLDILKKGFIAYAIQQPLTSYRIRSQSASSNKLKASSDLWKVYRQHEHLSFFKAFGCFVSYAYHAIKKRF